MTASTSLNAARRTRDLEALAGGEVVDVLVVGGGVTGAGVALEAASRGLSVALVERRDLAFGTSRWSSKLVHGGLRYLARGDVGLATECAKERGVLMERTAPHLTRPLPFVMPLNREVGRVDAALAYAGAVAGDVLRVAARTRRTTLPRPRRISAAETLLLAPALRPGDLRGAILGWDGQLVDDARLVIALARTAAGCGARILTYCAARAVDGSGAAVTDERSGATFAVRARHVVNATGVWAGTLDERVRLRPSRGTHVIVPAARLGDPSAATTTRAPGSRSRWILTLPVGDGRALVGLTDDPVDGDLPDVPEPTEDDIAYLLAAAGAALATPLERSDVIGAFAGMRPLLEGADGPTADLSRRHRLFGRDDGLLTIVGGKLTTYRTMAEQTVDAIAARAGVRAGPCRTRALPLVGAAPRPVLAKVRAPARIVARYGIEAPAVMALARADSDLARPVSDTASTIGAELAFGVAHEGALTAEDLLARRTRLDLVPADAEAARLLAEALLRHDAAA